jgi:hypothetical protein
MARLPPAANNGQAVRRLIASRLIMHQQSLTKGWDQPRSPRPILFAADSGRLPARGRNLVLGMEATCEVSEIKPGSQILYL